MLLRSTCHWLIWWVPAASGSAKALPLSTAVVWAIAVALDRLGVFGGEFESVDVVKSMGSLHLLEFPLLSLYFTRASYIVAGESPVAP
jgi:hypothetical protein